MIACGSLLHETNSLASLLIVLTMVVVSPIINLLFCCYFLLVLVLGMETPHAC